MGTVGCLTGNRLPGNWLPGSALARRDLRRERVSRGGGLLCGQGEATGRVLRLAGLAVAVWGRVRLRRSVGARYGTRLPVRRCHLRALARDALRGDGLSLYGLRRYGLSRYGLSRRALRSRGGALLRNRGAALAADPLLNLSLRLHLRRNPVPVGPRGGRPLDRHSVRGSPRSGRTRDRPALRRSVTVPGNPVWRSPLGGGPVRRLRDRPPTAARRCGHGMGLRRRVVAGLVLRHGVVPTVVDQAVTGGSGPGHLRLATLPGAGHLRLPGCGARPGRGALPVTGAVTGAGNPPLPDGLPLPEGMPLPGNPPRPGALPVPGVLPLTGLLNGPGTPGLSRLTGLPGLTSTRTRPGALARVIGPVRIGRRQGEHRAGPRLLRGGAFVRGGQGAATASRRLGGRGAGGVHAGRSGLRGRQRVLGAGLAAGPASGGRGPARRRHRPA
ncbi:hypothetical protein QC282_31955, partial [Streptomyces sp. DH24]|nr:hypothetical protein [Streptomyces sp. DH24]